MRDEIMSKPKYSLAAGRCIVFDGVPICALHKIGSDALGYSMDASDMDDFAKRLVDALNYSPYKPKTSDYAPRVMTWWWRNNG